MGNTISDATEPITNLEDNITDVINTAAENFVELVTDTEGNVVKVITNTEDDILTGYLDTEQNVTHLIGDTSTKVIATIDNQFDNFFDLANKYENDLFNTVQFTILGFGGISVMFLIILSKPENVSKILDTAKKINLNLSLI